MILEEDRVKSMPRRRSCKKWCMTVNKMKKVTETVVSASPLSSPRLNISINYGINTKISFNMLTTISI